VFEQNQSVGAITFHNLAMESALQSEGFFVVNQAHFLKGDSARGHGHTSKPTFGEHFLLSNSKLESLAR
jgi:hypothetical protein